MDRRELLKAGLITAGAAFFHQPHLWAAPQFKTDPFQLGVASGDPWPDSVVLWTRLAPDPLNGGGMPNEDVLVRWRIAGDEHMSKIVREGTVAANPEWAHSVHVEVQGLQPDRWYWYQFDVGTGVGRISSPIGRTKTAPAAFSQPDRFPFAFVSCQKYEAGFYTAVDHLCEEDISLVIHLGDYIYEKGPVRGIRDMPVTTSVSLESYRNRYAYYKMDPSLKRLHAQFPFAAVSDDHEVANNYAGLIPEKESQLPGFKERRAAAYRAYYEHMPFRMAVQPHDAYMTMYRTLRIGGLADIHMLDTRQFRTDQPCGDGTKPSCPEREGPSTMMGDVQEKWLQAQLGKGKDSHERWNILAQQIIFSQINVGRGDQAEYMMDKWDGYPQARKRLVDNIVNIGLNNVVILSGDNHNNWVFDVKTNPDDEKSPVLASEFAGTSLTSGGDGTDIAPEFAPILAKNPQVKFHNSQRGYVRCTVTPKQWTSDYRIVPYVSKPGAPIQTRASFVVDAGHAGAQKA
ncbi:MAG TPA: alkaline phosphatase D family protein [Edaphobacter sp.]|nr:alkaline phosphatase D family protein [Edaphobacter sp.]